MSSLLSALPPAPAERTGFPWTETSPPPPPERKDGSPWPHISIITPSYNQGRFLEETIRSVLLQAYPNLEYIVIDGGSTDESVEIIRKYEPWITHWESARDRGQCSAINKGLERATGEIAAWLNSDDTYLPGTLIRAAQVLTPDEPARLVYGSARFMDENSKLLHMYGARPLPEGILRCKFWEGWWVPQPATFFDRRLVTEFGLLDESFHYALDVEWVMRVSGHVRPKLLDEVLALYRLHPDSKTGTSPVNRARFDREFARAARRYAPPASPSSWALWRAFSVYKMERWRNKWYWRIAHHTRRWRERALR
jgi:glycosyltransferase involved in cell wall biosynthesis